MKPNGPNATDELFHGLPIEGIQTPSTVQWSIVVSKNDIHSSGEVPCLLTSLYLPTGLKDHPG